VRGDTSADPWYVRNSSLRVGETCRTPTACGARCRLGRSCAAVWLPLIVTRGGPTDEFTLPTFAIGVRAARRWSAARDYLFLEPERVSLKAAMLRVMSDRAFAATARTGGPVHAAEFSWDACARGLIRVALGEKRRPRDDGHMARDESKIAGLSRSRFMWDSHTNRIVLSRTTTRRRSNAARVSGPVRLGRLLTASGRVSLTKE